MFKKACPESLSEGSVQTCPERSRRKGRSRFDARSVRFVREHGKTATPGLASRSGKARERRWRLFSTFPEAIARLTRKPGRAARSLYCHAEQRKALGSIPLTVFSEAWPGWIGLGLDPSTRQAPRRMTRCGAEPWGNLDQSQFWWRRNLLWAFSLM